MVKLVEVAEKIRSKNAGPFWLTVDIFCGAARSFEQVRTGLSTRNVADILDQETASVKRYEIPSLFVIKFSVPRPTIQGSLTDRDIHGASWAALFYQIELN